MESKDWRIVRDFTSDFHCDEETSTIDSRINEKGKYVASGSRSSRKTIHAGLQLYWKPTTQWYLCDLFKHSGQFIDKM